MGAAIWPYINQVTTIDILIDFAWMLAISESFRRRPVVLAMSILTMLCAFRHLHPSSLTIIKRV